MKKSKVNSYFPAIIFLFLLIIPAGELSAKEFSEATFLIAKIRPHHTWFNGTIKSSGKTLEKVCWKNPEVLVTGGRFSFPYHGGEELTLSPFTPGYDMTPEQIILTG